jgi:hypothetical protein
MVRLGGTSHMTARCQLLRRARLPNRRRTVAGQVDGPEGGAGFGEHPRPLAWRHGPTGHLPRCFHRHLPAHRRSGDRPPPDGAGRRRDRGGWGWSRGWPRGQRRRPPPSTGWELLEEQLRDREDHGVGAGGCLPQLPQGAAAVHPLQPAGATLNRRSPM